MSRPQAQQRLPACTVFDFLNRAGSETFILASSSPRSPSALAALPALPLPFNNRADAEILQGAR